MSVASPRLLKMFFCDLQVHIASIEFLMLLLVRVSAFSSVIKIIAIPLLREKFFRAGVGSMLLRIFITITVL